MKFEPKRKTCPNCGGKKWYSSAIGLIACQVCGGSGKGGVDVDWLVKDWQRLKEIESSRSSVSNCAEHKRC